MTIKNVTHFVFPVGDKSLNAENYYRALAEAENGFFPISSSCMPHLGIHIDDKVLQALQAEEGLLKCIAQGEVVAYRVNDVYPKITYSSPNRVLKQRYAYFSTGFTLVRHRLAMPASAKKPPQESASPAAEDDSPAITLYSLYMHQLDWFGYEHKVNRHYPHYWDSSEATVNTRAILKGTIIRSKGKGSPGVGLLLKGSRIRLGENFGHGWYRLVSLDSGCIVTESGPQYERGALVGYVHRSDLEATLTEKMAEDKPYIVKGVNNDAFGFPAVPKTGAFLFSDPEQRQCVGCVLTETELQLGEKKGEYVQILDSQTKLPSQSAVWIRTSDLTMMSKPKAFNTVVVLETPVPIDAGQMIGYVGHYHNIESTSEYREPIFLSRPPARDSDNELRRQAHIEVFTCDDLPAFINETRPLAAEEASPWAWKDVHIIEENTPIAEMHQQLKACLDKKLSTDAMSPLIKATYDILKDTTMYEASRGKIRPSCHATWLKNALREHKTATQLGNLVIHFESEWYADEDLSKWTRIDDMLKGLMQQARARFEQELRKKNVLELKIKRSLSVFDDMHQMYDDEWQTEKKHRIRPLLWWKAVADAQSRQPKTNVSNLSQEAKAWFLHPIRLLDFKQKTLLSVRLLKQIFTRAEESVLKTIAEEINQHYTLFNLDTPLRLTHFFAQALQEVGVICTTKPESFDYDPEGLKRTFDYFKKNPQEATKYGRNKNERKKADQEIIANKAYGNKSALGNGDFASGDGWKYRARGLFQLTGRFNYTDFNSWYHGHFDNNVDFLENPDLILHPKFMIISAAFFWKKHKMFEAADWGRETRNINDVTNIINRQTNSKGKRVDNFRAIEKKNLFDAIFQ